MKKYYILLAGFLLTGSFAVNAQDTLMYEGFDFQTFYDNMVDDVVPPPANTTDPLWYSYDQDGAADGSGAGFTGGFQAMFPFSDVDTIDIDVDGFNDNTVIGANSWFSPFGQASNWLVTPSYTVGPLDTLFWKSATRQTPRYCDGYKVKISTTTNDDLAAWTTVFTAAEMTATGSDTTFSTFTFSSGWVHGADGNYIDITDGSATAVHRGQLAPHSYPLNAYIGQKIFVAFHHYTYDDFLISFDDVMIRGNNPAIGINEKQTGLGLGLWPNPATDNVQVNYELDAETAVTITVYDITGKVVNSISQGAQTQGVHFANINTATLAKGFYTVGVSTNNNRSTAKLIVR